MHLWTTILAFALAAAGGPKLAEPAVLQIDAGRIIHRVSPLLYGACIEDVNHEIYGGLYSQMIFGESFQEPAKSVPLKGFLAHGGVWRIRDGVLDAGPGDGPKLISEEAPLADAVVGVQIRFPSDQAGNAGLILRVDQPGTGADAFIGYEVSLETAGFLVLGRHRKNWEPLQRIPCTVPTDQWISLAVAMTGDKLEVMVGGRSKLIYKDAEHPLAQGRIGLRTWQRPASFRNLWTQVGGVEHQIAFVPQDPEALTQEISGMWNAVRSGSAHGRFELVPSEPFVGKQSQRLTFLDGEGSIGIENRGLNRWGLNFVAGKPYEGFLWARSEMPAKITLALESSDGARKFAQTSIEVKAAQWTRYDFALTSTSDDQLGRFSITLDEPGSITLGHVFLQPGEWGRFRGLPVRKDVAEGLIAAEIGVLRYGGSMINHPQYRWKEMIGPHDRRPTHAGTWYPYSTNGWGIFDFLNMCEAAGIVAIPDVSINESPQDMADFIEYTNGPAESPWGRKRAADGHPQPYRLKHLELGNEEAVNEEYWKKFQPMAEAIWAKDPAIILVVGDFAYTKVIKDPYNFEGGAAANSLAAHRKILELARTKGREVWFDIHVWTDHPPEPNGLMPERSYIDQLGKIAPGAKYKVVFFEYNSGNHAQKRALSNALATNEAERIGELLPMACAANCLQPDGQNDNGWDQGLLFLNPSKTWLQPPGFLIQMSRRNFQPLLVHSQIRGKSDKLSVNAKRSDDGKTLVIQVVNWDEEPRATGIEIAGYAPSKTAAVVEQLAGPLDNVNTAVNPDRIKPQRFEWKHELKDGKATYSFPAHSITLIRIE